VSLYVGAASAARRVTERAKLMIVRGDPGPGRGLPQGQAQSVPTLANLGGDAVRGRSSSTASVAPGDGERDWIEYGIGRHRGKAYTPPLGCALPAYKYLNHDNGYLSEIAPTVRLTRTTPHSRSLPITATRKSSTGRTAPRRNATRSLMTWMTPNALLARTTQGRVGPSPARSLTGVARDHSRLPPCLVPGSATQPVGLLPQMRPRGGAETRSARRGCRPPVAAHIWLHEACPASPAGARLRPDERRAWRCWRRSHRW
jgi:hypothetical protein